MPDRATQVTARKMTPGCRKTVTGRSYRDTRVRGLAAWYPLARTRVLIDHVKAVLVEYAEHLPMTNTQVFYRLTGVIDYPKTEDTVRRLNEHLNRALRSGMIGWDDLRDDQGIRVEPEGYRGIEHFKAVVRYMAEHYRRDLSEAHDPVVENWGESVGMVPQLVRMGEDLGVAVFSSGGFDGVKLKHQEAQRIIDRHKETGRKTVVIHSGDYDPDGCAIVDSLADDIIQFIIDADYPADIVQFIRGAVTPDQIERFDLPTKPQKGKVKKGEHMARTTQAEDRRETFRVTLTPAQLAIEVRVAIEQALGPDALDRMAELRAIEADERQELLDWIDGADSDG